MIRRFAAAPYPDGPGLARAAVLIGAGAAAFGLGALLLGLPVGIAVVLGGLVGWAMSDPEPPRA